MLKTSFIATKHIFLNSPKYLNNRWQNNFVILIFLRDVWKPQLYFQEFYILLFFGKFKHKFIFFPQDSQEKSTLVIFFTNQVGFSQVDLVSYCMHKIGQNEADEQCHSLTHHICQLILKMTNFGQNGQD